MKKNTPKKKKLSWYKETFWKIFSEYMRRSKADSNGNIRCVRCYETKRWKDFDPHHMIKKTKGLSVYFLEQDILVICRDCHCWITYQATAKEELELYAKAGRMEDYNYAESEAKKTTQYRTSDYADMIDKYKYKLGELEKNG